MTQEEKFKEAQRLYETANADQRYVLESLFPELKESEDEMIRKALIKFFTLSDDNADYQCCGVHYKDIVAWLEEKLKGEQKPTDKVEPKKLKFKAGDRIIGIVSGMQYYITEVCDDYYNTESGCIIMFCAQENFELYKQKSAEWSEEDETVLNNLIYALANDKIGNNRDEYVDWLKDLKERHIWKPSDEQMNALNDVISSRDIKYDVLSELWKDLDKLRKE